MNHANPVLNPGPCVRMSSACGARIQPQVCRNGKRFNRHVRTRAFRAARRGATPACSTCKTRCRDAHTATRFLERSGRISNRVLAPVSSVPCTRGAHPRHRIVSRCSFVHLGSRRKPGTGETGMDAFGHLNLTVRNSRTSCCSGSTANSAGWGRPRYRAPPL